MFPSLQLEVMDRFTAVEQYFKTSQRLRGDPSLTAKGLVFVQIYAIHEYTVQNVVLIASQEIAAHGHLYSDLQPSLLALFMEPELQSLRDCPPKDQWKRRLALFERAVSNQPILLTTTPIPKDGSHFRHTHVELILKVLGVKRTLTVRRRHLPYIDEVVQHRNSIAHGGETAGDIGRRYSRQEIRKSIRRMRNICLRLIMIVSEHCKRPTEHCR
jgi:hypothetical protein